MGSTHIAEVCEELSLPMLKQGEYDEEGAAEMKCYELRRRKKIWEGS